jgi:hypothetical protein
MQADHVFRSRIDAAITIAERCWEVEKIRRAMSSSSGQFFRNFFVSVWKVSSESYQSLPTLRRPAACASISIAGADGPSDGSGPKAAQSAPRVSPLRDAVKIKNSRASSVIGDRHWSTPRNQTRKVGTSCHGNDA